MRLSAHIEPDSGCFERQGTLVAALLLRLPIPLVALTGCQMELHRQLAELDSCRGG